MAYQFTGQQLTSADRCGQILFALKQHLVAQGWIGCYSIELVVGDS